MDPRAYAHPVLSCARAGEYEDGLFGGDEERAWKAMQAAGRELAGALLPDFRELRELPERLRVLGLVGKGNNGGDALIACGHLVADFPRAELTLIHAVPRGGLGPLADRACRRLPGERKEYFLEAEADEAAAAAILREAGGRDGFDVCIDGMLGMAFRPPLRPPFRGLVDAVNAYGPIVLRAAVDLPSGVGDESDERPFRADFTYATGIAKAPVLRGAAACGRVRYLDLGFFEAAAAGLDEATSLVLTPRVLDPLRRFRPSNVDKRTFGHLLILGGSAFMPGALLMAVEAAVRSGVGLVTAFAPASVAAALAAQVPEAMWVPWPETGNGTLSPRAIQLLYERMDRGSALLVGPGMGHDRFTELLTQEIVRETELPIVLDADALRLKAVELAVKRGRSAGPVILTPHLGEFARISRHAPDAVDDACLAEFCRANRIVTILKGPVTRICDGNVLLFNTCGGPVLSRGGSGDLLSGLVGGMVAQQNENVLASLARGVFLHGAAAQRLARARGQIAVRTTQLLDYLPAVLRADRVE
jgi:NAD(P)H-hydrate epimerase